MKKAAPAKESGLEVMPRQSSTPSAAIKPWTEESHREFAVGYLLPAIASYAEASGHQLQSIDTAAFVISAGLLLDSGISRESLMTTISERLLITHEAPECLQ